MSAIHSFVALCAAAAALIFATAGSPASAQSIDEIMKAGTLRIGVSAESVPMGYLNDKQELVGFEVDLANMVAKAMGVKVEIVPAPAASRIQYLLTNKVDMLIAFLAITPERAKQVLFSDTYSLSETVLYAPKTANIKTVADLKGMKIGTGRGNLGDIFLTKALGTSATIMRFDDTATTYQAVRSNQVDAVSGSVFSTANFVKGNPDIKWERKLTLVAQHNGMVVRKGSYELQQFLNAFIVYSKASGELGEIYLKWFNETMPAF